MDHTAVIKFVENRFIGSSTHQTARDAAQSKLLGFFDFTNVPWATPPTPPAPVTPSSLGYNLCTPASMGPQRTAVAVPELQAKEKRAGRRSAIQPILLFPSMSAYGLKSIRKSGEYGGLCPIHDLVSNGEAGSGGRTGRVKYVQRAILLDEMKILH
jgi:hypothetical protein